MWNNIAIVFSEPKDLHDFYNAYTKLGSVWNSESRGGNFGSTHWASRAINLLTRKNQAKLGLARLVRQNFAFIRQFGPTRLDFVAGRAAIF